MKNKKTKTKFSKERRKKHNKIAKEFHNKHLTLAEIEKLPSMPFHEFLDRKIEKVSVNLKKSYWEVAQEIAQKEDTTIEEVIAWLFDVGISEYYKAKYVTKKHTRIWA